MTDAIAVSRTKPVFSEVALALLKKKYFLPGEDETAMLERVSFGNPEYYEFMARGEFLPNSPTLFNAGTDKGSLSACFKFDVPDTMEGIMDVARKAALVLKWGGGVGYALGALRPRGSTVHTTHKVASGPVGFLTIYHAVAVAVTQAGKRDGAQMAILPCDHPDVREFIHCKDNSSKLDALVAQYKDSDPTLAAEIHNSILSTFNISVACTDEFMRNSLSLDQRDVPPTSLLYEMAKSAWETGDPGCYFIDTANKSNPTPWLGELSGTNPCGEVPLLNDEPCNLGSLNLSKFVRRSTRDFDWIRLEKGVRLMTRFLDDILDNNRFPDEAITRAAFLTRKLGGGVMGWADALALMHIHYDTDEAIALAETVSLNINRWAFDESVNLGREKGICPAFIGHEKETTRLLSEWGFGDDTYYNYSRRPEIFSRVPDLPRNATRTCIAPTGSISILLDASSGIEPHYALTYYHMNAGQITFPVVEEAIASGFTPKIASEIDWPWHVKMQAAWQKNIDLAVSKTINLPKSATIDDIYQSYIMMWELGCKGGTIYRDQSRGVQVFNAEPSNNGHNVAVIPAPNGARLSNGRRRLPDERPSITHKFRVGEQEGYMTVGLYEDGTPGELFITINKEGSTVAGLCDALGIMVSIALQHGVNIENITRKLRHVAFEPSGMTGNQTIPFASSLIDYIAHWLEHKFLGEHTEVTYTNHEINTLMTSEQVATLPIPSGMLCPDCGSTLQIQEGCRICRRCGWTTCS